MTQVLLVGNPNCGKTTLFNALTGDHQRVGNWPGVTVEKKMGTFDVGNHTIQLTDLPGIYSLTVFHDGSSLDEKITAQAVVSEPVDFIINVIDACQLERHLYLTSQLLELGKPLIIALNMTDIAAQRGIVVDTAVLSEHLGCPVVPIQAHRNQGLDQLIQAIVQKSHASSHLTHHHDSFISPQSTFRGVTASPSEILGAQDANAGRIVPFQLSLPLRLFESITHIEEQLKKQNTHTPQQGFYWANRLLEGCTLVTLPNIMQLLPDESDVLMADARYQAVHHLVQQVQKKRSDASEHLTAKIDRVVLHRFWALPIFFGVMYLMFFAAINVGGAFQDFFDIGSDAIFVQGVSAVLHALSAPRWLIALIADGVGKGINTTLTFIPVIASMFFFLSLLETSGYMARAAFVVDKVMRALGLPGKSFVPMIVGFGCNVPAILAARTLDSERDRLLTVLMSPFMSCSARLAIYAIFVATFFPVGGQNIVFSLYVIGILMAVLTGLLLRKIIFKGSASPLLLELPAYHKPSLRRLMKETSMRLKYFIFRAGKLIIPVCTLLGGLNALTIGNGGETILAMFGKWVTPIFSPMGIQPDNWPATMGLLTGILAKEVVVGTLHSLYSQMGHLAETTQAGFDFGLSIKAALVSIPDNMMHLGQLILHPLSTSGSGLTLPSAVGEVMYRQFDGQVGAYAYLLFVLLYVPCVSTMAVIHQEAGRRFMWLSVIWSFILAYGLSVGFYQFAQVMNHPKQTIYWLFTIVAVFVMTGITMRRLLGNPGGAYATATS